MCVVIYIYVYLCIYILYIYIYYVYTEVNLRAGIAFLTRDTLNHMAAKRCGTDSLNTPLAAKMTSGAVLIFFYLSVKLRY